MVEKISKWGESKSSAPIDKDFIVGVVPLSHIALNPEERFRLESGNYKLVPKYIGIKSTMEMFGLYHTIILRRKENKDYLLGGFVRFCIAVELGWKEIGAKTYFDLTDYEATIIEITENTNRIDFTSFEVIMAIGKAKTHWERLHPDTRRGKYNRSRSKNEIISDGETLMQSQNNQDISGFAKENYKILGISKRTLYRRIQLYNAIENNTFDEKTINSFRNEKITYSQLLNKLRKIENKRKIRKNLEASNIFQTKTISLPDSKEKIIKERIGPKDSSTILSVAEKERNSDSFKNNKYTSDTSKINTSYNDLEKAEKIYEASKTDPHIKDQWKKVKRQEISLEKGFENSQKIKQVNKSIKEGIVKKFEETGKAYKEKTKKFNREAHDIGASKKKENSLGLQNLGSIKQMYVCKRCPKATVMAVECECEECGHHNFTPTVLCDDDIINGFSKLRNPNSVLCEKSPYYDLVLKKVF